MKMKINIMLLLFLLLLLINTGCWNRTEPENILIILAVGFERDRESGDMRMIVQAVNPAGMGQGSPEGNGGGGSSSIWVGEAVGRTVFAAAKGINIKSTRQGNFTHTNVILISEELAREGINDILDFLDRERQLRAIARPIVLEGDLRKAMEAEFPLEETGATAILNNLNVSQKELSTTVDLKIRHMFNRLTQPGWELVLPRVKLIEEENGELSEENPLAVSGLAAFKQDQLVGWLNDQETRGLNWLNNNINRVTYVLKSPPQDEKEVSVEVYESIVSLQAILKDEKVVIKVEIRADGRVQETTAMEQWLSVETELTDSLDRRLAQAIRNDIIAVIKTAQQDLGTDILGFGNLIYRTLPREWEKLEPRWNGIFPETQVEIIVDANVRRTGLVKDPIQIR